MKFFGWFSRCNHADAVRRRYDDGSYGLICDCGFTARIDRSEDERAKWAKTQKKLAKSRKTPVTPKKPAEIVPMRRGGER